MKKIPLILAVCYIILSACSKNNAPTGTGTQGGLVKDTIKIAAIDTLMNQLGKQWKPGPNFHSVMLGERDSVQYLEVDGEAQRLSALFNTDTSATWLTVFQVKNELALVRFRQWTGYYRPVVKEAICYFDNGKIFYSKERGKALEQGEQIGAFRELDFVENVRTAEELTAEYLPYWEVARKGVEEDLKKRK